MAKKKNLKQAFDTQKEHGGTVLLAMILPYSEGDEVAEIITVRHEYLDVKWDYIDKTYDDNLVMKNNPAVRIKYFG